MPRLGDISRSAETYVSIDATPAMNVKAALLLCNAAYAWFEHAPPWINL
jgi:hypothetical protein